MNSDYLNIQAIYSEKQWPVPKLSNAQSDRHGGSVGPLQ